MRIILILFAALLSFTSHANASFKEGNSAYANGDFEGALTAYQKLIAAEEYSSELYYNLGNTYYKLSELGKAIWAYERALKIDPSNENAQYNLNMANASTVDDIDTSNSGIIHWLKITLFSFSINFWVFMSIAFSLVFSVALYIYRTTNVQKHKNRSLNASVGSMVLLITAVLLAYYNKSTILSRTEAIITIEVVDLKPSPSETSPTAFQLHEGTKVKLLRSNDGWTEVDINGNTGWIEKKNILEI